VFTIAIYFWCSVAALAFVATFFMLAAEYAIRVLRAAPSAPRDEIDDAPRSTIVPAPVVR
jgi:hypothetical protein